ncbi:MAG TPA: hypothetical protein VEC99_14870 [Clostridia bacterium]|nr:hypothetical protein [Clostridia bacterium]
MNDYDGSSLPAQESNAPVQIPRTVTQLATATGANPDLGSPASYPWGSMRRFLACNPLYLMSAALLLYSFYLVSADPNFLLTEVAKLSFNLGSLQLYEVLVVATAIFLARRAVWYDSTLLVGLENLLVLVPFILVSQAALIEPRLVWILCAAGGLLAATRLSFLKRFIAQLNIPPRLLGAGALVLVANMALPVVYRVLHESKVGTKPDWGAAYETNQYLWWLMMPVLCALSHFVPLNRNQGKLWPQRSWLPLGIFGLWLVGTGVHLYCLGYVYDFSLRPELLAPAIWTLLWVIWLRVSNLVRDLEPAWVNTLWLLPFLATLLAAPQPGKEVFLVLTIWNVAIYGYIYYQRRAPVALHLTLISLVALLAGLPEDWGRSLATDFSREKFVGGAAVIYLLGCLALSRSPKAGVIGALIAMTTVCAVGDASITAHWAAQIGLAFLVLHSFRWEDSLHDGTKLVRWLASAAWVVHSLIWTHACGAGWGAYAVALPVLGVCLAVRWLQGHWGPIVVAIAALLVMLCAPSQVAAGQLKSTPGALLAVIGSFVLFGLGTLAAITKHKWGNLDKRPGAGLPGSTSGS